jgi:predicted nucleic acid-binding protein
MKNEFDYLLDSDVLVGRFFPDDPHNQNARNMFEVLEDKRKSLVTTSLVVVETATVLSHKASQALAIKFLQVVNRGNMPIIHINEGLQFNIPAIVSFDKVYRKRFGLKVYC